MLTVWLYLTGALAACGYAIGAAMGWIPSTTPLAALCLGVALAFVLTAEFANRRAHRNAFAGLRVLGGRALPRERDYRALVNRVDDVIFETDTDATLTFLSDAWKNVTLLDVQACLHTPLFRYLHPDDHALNREQFLTLLSNRGGPGRYETRLINRDGQQCWVELRIRPLTDRRGTVTGITGVMSDIQSRKRAEDILRARDRGLSTLLDHLPGMAFRCRNDRSWTMEFVSDGCFDLTGYEAVDLLNQPSYEKLIHAEDRRYVWDYVQNQLAQGKAYHLRYRLRTREGQEKWVDERGRGVFAGDGALLAIEGFVSDISSQKREEERVEREPLRDTLTGLKSRALLTDRITSAMEQQRPFLVLCIDIDNLKRINERHGRAAGDALLRGVGERLAALCASGLAAARHGGDEFAILAPLDHPLPEAPGLPQLTHQAAATLHDPHTAGVLHGLALADRIARLLERPFVIADRTLSLTARIGIALSTDKHADAGAVLQSALHAAYSAQWSDTGSAVRYAFAGDDVRQAALAWRHSAAEFAREFNMTDLSGLSVTLARVIAAPRGAQGALATLPDWREARLQWHSPRIGIVPTAHLFTHAAANGTLGTLAEAATRLLCARALPQLQAGERLCLSFEDALPDNALLLGVQHGLPATDAGTSATCDILLGVPALPAAGVAPGAATSAEPLTANLDAAFTTLREAGVRIGIDITILGHANEIPAPDWLGRADYWRIRFDATRPLPARLARMIETAAAHGIPVVAAGATTHPAALACTHWTVPDHLHQASA
ncbi:PAS domain S-box protein [Imbroritus primus]|uniref:PAS domain S-box protein n=1 Tax=Imbroritus primus TaxID=3058603 RepID=A0ACD3SN45_9BURK|nr:PAS domain S-box protein [Burkholderiaceae bacterium PBA]